MAATKFTEDERAKLFTPSGWTREYTITTVPSLCRMERGKAIVTSKVLVATAVTITRLGSHTGTGEEWADRENAVTAVDAQAFKRACSCFGLGRYLYRFRETRVRLNSRGEPVAIPTLPEWALPPGMTMAQTNSLAGDMRGPVDQRLTAEIEGFRETLGKQIYKEILRRGGHSADARTIPNAERQRQTIEWMQAAARGFERLRHLTETVGEARFTTFVEHDEENEIVHHRERWANELRLSELYPEIIDADAGEDPLPSCSAIEALERQEPFINQTLAMSALAMLARLLRYGKIAHHGGFFNAATGKMTALAVDPELWRKTRRRSRKMQASLPTP